MKKEPSSLKIARRKQQIADLLETQENLKILAECDPCYSSRVNDEIKSSNRTIKRLQREIRNLV